MCKSVSTFAQLLTASMAPNVSPFISSASASRLHATPFMGSISRALLQSSMASEMLISDNRISARSSRADTRACDVASSSLPERVVITEDRNFSFLVADLTTKRANYFVNQKKFGKKSSSADAFKQCC